MIVYVGLGPESQRMHYRLFPIIKITPGSDNSLSRFPLLLVSFHGILQNRFTSAEIASGSSKMTKWSGCCIERNVEARVLSVVLGVTWLLFRQVFEHVG